MVERKENMKEKDDLDKSISPNVLDVQFSVLLRRGFSSSETNITYNPVETLTTTFSHTICKKQLIGLAMVPQDELPRKICLTERFPAV